MKYPDKKAIEEIRKRYPKGTRIELVSMQDVQAPPPGTTGVVYGVDAAGAVLVDWSNGSTLNVLLDAGDQIRIIGGDQS